MTEEIKIIYSKLRSKWKGQIYQNYRKSIGRFYLINPVIDIFKDKDVLEIGSNAGLYSLKIMEVARSYIGIDKDKHFHAQAKITKKVLGTDNVEFVNNSLSRFVRSQIRKEIEYNYNALFASFIIYHLNEKEISMLEEFILPKIEVAIIQTRNKLKDNNLNQYKDKNKLVNFIESNGFCVDSYWAEERKVCVIKAIKAK